MLPDAVGCGVQQTTIEVEAFAYEAESRHMASAVLARRNEFIAGRSCARMALAQIGQAACALPADADGLPIWPAATMGSITHSRGWCCAVAASANTMTYLGIDLEKTNRLSARAMKRVVHPLEAPMVGEDQILGSLLFSAKEAFFKAQFPVWHATLNFTDIALHIDTDTQQLSVQKITTNLPAQLRDATDRMQFRYEFVGDYVVTLCWLQS